MPSQGNDIPVKHKNVYHRLHSATAHDWEGYKNKDKDIWDDGTMTFFWEIKQISGKRNGVRQITWTMTFFWNAHTITVLVIFSCILVYVAMFEEPSPDSNYNMKRGITAMVLAFLLFGVTQTPDGPFRRPHPALWRLVLCLSIVYELSLVYLLFQTVEDARLVMKNFDLNLGKPLPEKSYGGNCLIYDPGQPENPFHMFWDKMDGFVATHFFGWWLKTLIIRDWWFCLIISVMFEILEYTLEHQLPNFSECWWDHWIMDALVCNGLGIYLGMKTLNYLSMKPYHWRGMWNISDYRGKMKRIALQFTPYSWTDFNWKPFSSLRRWLAVLAYIFMFLLAELNTFYLKFVLWIPPEHYLCLTRLVFFLFMGAAALREGFQFLDDPNCKKFGRQAWLMAAIIITELLVTVKFGWETIIKPVPAPVSYFWIIGVIGLVMYTVWKFYIKRDVKNDIVIAAPKEKKAVMENGQEEKDRVYTRLRASNNNNTKSEGVHQRAKTKNGPSVL